RQEKLEQVRKCVAQSALTPRRPVGKDQLCCFHDRVPVGKQGFEVPLSSRCLRDRDRGPPWVNAQKSTQPPRPRGGNILGCSSRVGRRYRSCGELFECIADSSEDCMSAKPALFRFGKLLNPGECDPR